MQRTLSVALVIHRFFETSSASVPAKPICDAERVVGRLQKWRKFGNVSTGVSRIALSDPDIASRRYIMEELEGTGMEAQLDGVGNVFARRPEHKGRPALLIGSHTDTQVEGGWLDGALGVAYAIEAAYALGPAAPLEVVDWSDEEGRFGILLGSPAFALGTVDWDAHCSMGTNATLASAASAHGLGKSIPLRTLKDGAPLLGYLEAHIEQGPRLERAGQQIAVVEGIVGVHQWLVILEGEQNHAGGTAMVDRRDAAAAAMRVGARLNDAVRDAAGDDLAVWGVNMVNVQPNQPSVVNGYAEMVMQFRAASSGTLDRMDAAVASVVAAANGEGGVSTRLEKYQANDVEPVHFDVTLKDQVAAAANARAPAGSVARLWSWAFHDASAVGPVLPTAMLFIPSIKGLIMTFYSCHAN
eukprot:gnl/MRDRNA2_/MRDRNA2_20207_c0_seq2.p1 gnl/MRDRNA2_/MRDRNA2_20207_c0~~gnl/MRDRNA2_/MRDRNA2_20207_c0_seq2.p1  ORF type:complete len:413 (-),score=85.43 gnl/MRDRNA2_/MRDRNA2_20207_c0_seq2:294-1532(-)